MIVREKPIVHHQRKKLSETPQAKYLSPYKGTSLSSAAGVSSPISPCEQTNGMPGFQCRRKPSNFWHSIPRDNGIILELSLLVIKNIAPPEFISIMYNNY